MLEQNEIAAIERLVAQNTRPLLNLSAGLVAMLRQKGVLNKEDLEQLAYLVQKGTEHAKDGENHAVSSAVITALQALRDGPRGDA